MSDGRTQAFVGLAVVLSLAVFWPTMKTFHTMWVGGTYIHGYVIALLTAWLIWRDRHLLAPPDEDWVPALLPVVGFSLLWFIGVVLNAQTVHQVALSILLLSWGLAVFGLGHFRVLGPIWATFFLAVPVWEVLVPPLQAMTVVVVATCLKVLDIPADVQGEFITVAAGTFRVAGTCAGLKFLLAGLVVGVLYAHLFIKERWVQVAMVGAAALLAIVSNWFRVTGLVIIGHRTQMESSLMEDHNLYGWVIFTVSQFVFFVIAARIERFDTPAGQDANEDSEAVEGSEEVRGSEAVLGSGAATASEGTVGVNALDGDALDDKVLDDKALDDEAPHDEAPDDEAPDDEVLEDDWEYAASGLGFRTRLLLVTAFALLGPILFYTLDRLPSASPAEVGVYDYGGNPEWQRLDPAHEKPFAWQAEYQGVDEIVTAAFTKDDVDVFLDRLVYYEQNQGAELINARNHIAADSALGRERVVGPVNNQGKTVREALIRTPEGLVLVWYWFRVAGVDTPSTLRAKALELVAFLTRSRQAELVALSIACPEDDCSPAFDTLVEFVAPVQAVDGS